jgi:Rrf2 family protein
MKVSTKGRYGVRFMLDLALNGDGGAVALRDAARRQQISEKYLWQVLGPLKAAGLIVATRGARGGYALAKPPAKITLREMVTTLEGERVFVDAERESSGAEPRATHEMWKALNRKLSAAMEAITLQSLADRQKALEDTVAPLYEI